jgi:CheY-like chemotaxis protein
VANGAILIVGDGSPASLSCGDLLRRAGYGVVEAASIDAALRLMRRATPAVLLLRIDADAAALRLCRRVRSHPPFTGLPVLGIVAGRPRLRLTGAGFSELVREPFSGEQLLRMVGRWLPVPAARDAGRRDSRPLVAPTSEWRGLSPGDA